ncbi:MAG: xanthine dehydrogenase family protein molybdopterin-binding subunit [Candidatus Tectomicrobia bacterium]|nr:xanthine dehydrogenase family protein molybdopterin-binding subunit [Candidatus Tectomicrobia bacterium]
MGRTVSIGSRAPNIEAAEKSRGGGRYVSDIVLPGMLWGKILHSPYPHARILHIDASRAETLRGVRAVVTAADTLKKPYGGMIQDEQIFAVDKVRFAGEEVAAVAATDLEVAEEALELIQVEYELLPAYGTVEEALAEGALPIHDDKPDNIAYRLRLERGDVDAALRSADEVIDNAVRTSPVHQCYLEPIACVADWGRSGRLTLYAPVHNPALIRLAYAPLLGVGPGDIRVVHSYIGGSFGPKFEHSLHLICAILARKTGKPVRVVHTRGEEFLAGRPRVPMSIKVRLGGMGNGTIVGKEMSILADNGAYTDYAPAIAAAAAYRMDQTYRIPNLRADVSLVYTNRTPTGAFRGGGSPQGNLALDTSIDMFAEKIGMDPAEVRLKNVVRTGDVTSFGWKVNSAGGAECIEKAAQASGWKEKRERFRNRTGPKKRGIGISACIHVSGNREYVKEFDGSSAILRMSENGKLLVLSGEVDYGQGSRTVMAQVAAEVLGMRIEDISVSPIDTDVTPFGLGAFAARTTTVAGRAVIDAAQKVKRELLEAAAELLEIAPEDVALEDGKVIVKAAPAHSISLREAARYAVFRKNAGNPIVHKGEYNADAAGVEFPDPLTKQGNLSTAYPFAAHVVEVEVDEETGAVQVVGAWAAHDVGRVINPLMAEGQVEGGFAQGLGYALMENIHYTRGVVENPSFYDYRVPTQMDVPERIESLWVESNDPLGPFGAKGLGEPTTVPVAASTANAIYNAIGVRVHDVPFTPEKILQALEAKRTSGR